MINIGADFILLGKEKSPRIHSGASAFEVLYSAVLMIKSPQTFRINQPHKGAHNSVNANSRQKEAVTASGGPVLITAGPGTGKTFTLVQRTLYLIEHRGVLPENILIATFTEKAARELITRISDELLRRNITANLNDMYIGTFILFVSGC